GRQVDVQAAWHVVGAVPDDIDVVLERTADHAGVITDFAALHAESGAKVAREGISGNDDTALDQHLVDRTVDHGDELAHLRNLLRDVADHQGVGTLVGDDAATLRQEAVLLVRAPLV